MEAVAPFSVLLVGLLGLLVLVGAVLRIVVLERRLVSASATPPLVPPTPRAGTSLAA